MILIRKDHGKVTFQLVKQEKELLLALLAHYPLIPDRHQPLSKSAAPAENESNQRLLDEALAEHRQANQRRIRALVEDSTHFRKSSTGWRLVLKDSEIEWLLQVLNDIRIGSWILLGAPEENVRDLDLNESTAPHAWTMETAGWFESALLEALHGES